VTVSPIAHRMAAQFYNVVFFLDSMRVRFYSAPPSTTTSTTVTCHLSPFPCPRSAFSTHTCTELTTHDCVRQTVLFSAHDVGCCAKRAYWFCVVKISLKVYLACKNSSLNKNNIYYYYIGICGVFTRSMFARIPVRIILGSCPSTIRTHTAARTPNLSLGGPDRP